MLLLVALGIIEWRAHLAALAGLTAAFAVSTLIYGMPLPTAAATTLYGAAYGFLPIGWIILNVIFLYNLANERGLFAPHVPEAKPNNDAKGSNVISFAASRAAIESVDRDSLTPRAALEELYRLKRLASEQ